MPEAKLAPPEQKQIDQIVKSYEGKSGSLLGILEDTQKINKNNFLPEETLNYISFKTNVPLSRIYSIVTFYSFFNLKPQGDHTVVVCRGTACHTKGSKSLLDDLAQLMGCIKELEGGEPSFTTPDNKFTIRTVACFGQCALAPVVSIDGVIHSNVSTTQMRKLVAKVSKGRK
jgi:NADH-quinone oxidoreductase subunit E